MHLFFFSLPVELFLSPHIDQHQPNLAFVGNDVLFEDMLLSFPASPPPATLSLSSTLPFPPVLSFGQSQDHQRSSFGKFCNFMDFWRKELELIDFENSSITAAERRMFAAWKLLFKDSHNQDDLHKNQEQIKKTQA